MIVVWRVTTDCNLDCPFCAYAKSESIPRRALISDRALGFAPVLQSYAQSQSKSVLVSWLGGEPLLWPEIFALSSALRSRFGLRVGVTTNGTGLCSDAAINRASECFDEITISIDAPGDIHDRLRAWPGGFEKLRSVIARLNHQPRRPLIRINTVLMKDTIGQFPALCDALATWGIDEITFNQLGGNDRPAFYDANRLTTEQIQTFAHTLSKLRERLARAGVRLAGGPRYLERLFASAANKSLPIDDCDPATDFLFIDELGRVSPCSFTIDDYAVPVHTLDSPMALVALRARYRARIAQQRSRWCLNCQSTRIFNKFVA